jgi:hypothetical protein
MLWHAEQMLQWWICSKFGYRTDMAGANEGMLFWGARLANAMYCTVFVCDDAKVRCGGFNWVNNQWSDLYRIIWPKQVWSISKGTTTFLSGCYVHRFFLQCVLKFSPSLFKVWEWLVLLANFGYAVACGMLNKFLHCKWIWCRHERLDNEIIVFLPTSLIMYT